MGINIAYIFCTEEILDKSIKPIQRQVYYGRRLPITIRPGQIEESLYKDIGRWTYSEWPKN